MWVLYCMHLLVVSTANLAGCTSEACAWYGLWSQRLISSAAHVRFVFDTVCCHNGQFCHWNFDSLSLGQLMQFGLLENCSVVLVVWHPILFPKCRVAFSVFCYTGCVYSALSYRDPVIKINKKRWKRKKEEDEEEPKPWVFIAVSTLAYSDHWLGSTSKWRHDPKRRKFTIVLYTTYFQYVRSISTGVHILIFCVKHRPTWSKLLSLSCPRADCFAAVSLCPLGPVWVHQVQFVSTGASLCTASLCPLGPVRIHWGQFVSTRASLCPLGTDCVN